MNSKIEPSRSILKDTKKTLSSSRPSKIIDTLAEEEEMINLTVEEHKENNTTSSTRSNNFEDSKNNDKTTDKGKYI